MLRKILKWIGGGIGVLVAVALIFYFLMYIVVANKRDKTYNVEVRVFDIPSDSATIAEGAHIYATKGCTDCHGGDLSGKTFLEDGMIGTVSGANLTTGKGGRPQNYSNRDWIMAMRHGLKSDGKPLIIMPSYEYYKLADHDLASLIAYCKSVPAVDHEPATIKLGPLGTVLSGLDKLPLIPAEKIDHLAKHTQKMERSVSVEYGQYLSMSCTGCHKPNLKGGENPIPGGTPVRDITASGNIGKWTQNQFVSALRTGATPDGRQLKNEDMPWKMTNNYTDEELQALYLYLKTL
jgi:mono/diheme cytochrome c family protein